MSTRPKRLRTLLKWTLLATVPFALLLALVVYIYTVDGPPVDDAHLRVRYPYEGENGVEAFRGLVDWVSSDQSRINAVLDPYDQWISDNDPVYRLGPELADEILERDRAHPEIWARLDDVGRSDYLFLDLPQRLDASLEHLSAVMKAARYGVAVADALAAKGQYGAAMERHLAAWRLGWRMTRMSEGILNNLVGASVEAIALNKMNELVGEVDNRALLWGALRELTLGEDDEDLLNAAIRSEYVMTANVVDLLSKADPTQFRDVLSWGGSPTAPVLIWARLCLKPENSKRMLAAAYNELIDPGSLGANDRLLLDAYAEWRRSGAFWKAAHPNAVPFYVAVFLVPDIGVAKTTIYEIRARRELVATLIALRLYQLDHGKVPDALGALVPVYFEAVPLDPFDGKPIRYDAERKVLWSIGRDGVDQGGVAQDDHRDEIVVPINF